MSVLDFRFAYPILFLFFLPLFISWIWWRLCKYKPIIYTYSLTSVLQSASTRNWFSPEHLLFAMRVIQIIALIFLLMRPQLVDRESKLPVEGVDIMLVLDVSGSMDTADFSDDPRTRFVVAKQEAIRFIKKRSHDAMGLVFFGKYAISRCPITFDKKLLRKILEDLQLGFVDPDGTVLSRAIIAAVNRLRNSASKTKIMIVLTDGEPSEDDVDISIALQAAQRYGIKIYTVGIGSDHEQVVFHPLYGPIIRAGVNTELLSQIATDTGGQMFMAHNAIDMRLIYDTIDQLERTAHDVPLFKHQIDLYQVPLFFVFVLFLVELLLSTTIWFCL